MGIYKQANKNLKLNKPPNSRTKPRETLEQFLYIS